MAQAVSQEVAVSPLPPPSLAPSPLPGRGGDELPPNNLNGYVRSKLSKGEVINFNDCARALGKQPGLSLKAGRLAPDQFDQGGVVVNCLLLCS